MNRKLFWCVLLVLLLITGCGTFSRMETSQPLPTSTPFSLPPTWTPQPILPISPTGTEYVYPTFTVVPAITFNSNFTETPEGKWSNYIPLVSPNGDWVAYYNLSEIRIVKGEDNIWTLPCELFDGCSYIKAVSWSRNSRYLYFGASTYLGGAPDEIALFSTAGKINVKTGEWQKLFQEPKHYFDFAVSPDGNFVAFIEQYFSEQPENNKVVLTVLDLGTGERVSYSVDGLEGGNIVWSPYKPRIVFMTRDPDKGTSVVYFDVDADVLRYVLKDKPDKFFISLWLENNLVMIYRMGQSGEISSELYLNPFTGELSQVIPTPTP